MKPIVILLFTACLFFSCAEESLTDSIFAPVEALDPDSPTYELDLWLRDNYTRPYNLDFRYKMEDIASELDYNLTPVRLEQAIQMAILVKYLWFDAYTAAVDDLFLRKNGPRIIHLIGSPAYTSTGAGVGGSAESGIKVNLYRGNDLNPDNVAQLNSYYFENLHHEFAHILHQKKSYPREFETYSAAYYDASAWHTRSNQQALSLGFVSRYAGSQPREDLAEIVCKYIIMSEAEWQSLLEAASLPGEYNTDGKALILLKLQTIKGWFAQTWGVDLDRVRAEVHQRQLHINEILAKGLQ